MTIIAVICPGPPERTPSTYYRFGQYKDLWRDQGAELIFVPKQELKGGSLKLLHQADVIVNQKCLLPSWYFHLIRRLGKPLFFDLDDMIWHRAGKDYSFVTKLKIFRRILLWAKGVDKVMCANTCIQEGFFEKTGVKALVVPMSLNMGEWSPARLSSKRPDDPSVHVGWTGSPEYHWLLRNIESAVKVAMAQSGNIRFSIHSGSDPGLNCDYEFVQWEKGGEAEYVKSLDIGLLPMDEASIFSMGKSPIKGLQYLATGVVPLGNFIGASLDFLMPSNSIQITNKLSSWSHSLLSATLDRELRFSKAMNGIEFTQKHHCRIIVGEHLLSILKSN